MNVFIYIISLVLIVAGASVFVKKHHPTTAKMGRTEHLLICFFFITGGMSAIVTKRWLPILITLGLVWTIYGLGEHKRRRIRPILTPQEYSDLRAIKRFMEWWLSNDSQVGEIRRQSTREIWNEGYRPTGIAPDIFSNAEDCFVADFITRLLQLQHASEQEWINHLQETGHQTCSFLETMVKIDEEYNRDSGKFNYRDLDKQITDRDALAKYKQAFLSERHISNQRRLLMWLFHARFGRWYTPQG